jgi:hypothetical protein
MNTASRFLAAASALVVFVFGASPARAEPWFGWGQTKTEDRYTSGDIDIEDLVNGTVAGRSRTEKDELRAGTWLTLGSYWRSYEGRYQDIGLFLMAGVAFDRIARASHGSSVEVIADGTSKLRPGSSATDAPRPTHHRRPPRPHWRRLCPCPSRAVSSSHPRSHGRRSPRPGARRASASMMPASTR